MTTIINIIIVPDAPVVIIVVVSDGRLQLDGSLPCLGKRRLNNE